MLRQSAQITMIVLAATALSSQADVISFGNSDLTVSTTTGFIEITAPAGVDPSNIPADGTFTSPFTATIPGGNVGQWYRYTFVLPAGFTGVGMRIQLSVDNEVQVYLNDQTIAVEDDTVVQNFGVPFPEFTLSSTGVVTNVSGTWDALPIAQSMFQVGVNELTFFATNNGGPGAFTLEPFGSTAGSVNQISFNGETQPPPNGEIPEPASAVMLLVAAAGLLHRRRAA